MAMQSYGSAPSRNRAVNAEKKPRGLIQRAMQRKRKARRPKR